jgi:hypothetical protein
MRAAFLLVLAAGSGCANLIGIEDTAQHLPRLDGDYLVAINRLRADNQTRDTIRMTGRATLDVDDRSLDLSVGILPIGGGSPLSETSISNVEFPADSNDVEYTIVLAIPAGAIAATPPPSGDDLTINATVTFVAEADYSFCARRIDGERDVTLGSVLVPSLQNLPPEDTDCDDFEGQ